VQAHAGRKIIVPRLAEIRAPAEPHSKLQRDKYGRMLAAAAELASVNDLDHVQMQDVAKRASVSIATLYRYFPSKTHLFVNVMLSEIANMSEGLQLRDEQVDGLSPVDSATDALIRALRALLRRPMVASSMIYAANSAQLAKMPGVARVDENFREALMAATQLRAPTEDDLIILRLLEQQWFAIALCCLNGLITAEEAEADVRLACELLLVPLSSMEQYSTQTG